MLRQEDRLFLERYAVFDKSTATQVELNIVAKCYQPTWTTTDDFCDWRHQTGCLHVESRQLTCSNCKKTVAQSLQNVELEQLVNLVGEGHEDLINKMPTTMAYALLITSIETANDQATDTILKKWPFTGVDLTLIPHETYRRALADKVLDLFIEDYSNTLLHLPPTANIREIKIMHEKTENWLATYRKMQEFVDMIDRLEDAGLRWNFRSPKYTIHAELHATSESTFMDVSRTVRDIRRPVRIRFHVMNVPYVQHTHITNCLNNTDPATLTAFATIRLQYTAWDIDELKRTLTPCSNLTELSLTTICAAFNTEALSRSMKQLMTQLSQLKHLSLIGFPITGFAGNYTLPANLLGLKLENSRLNGDDWTAFAGGPGSPKLRELMLLKCMNSDFTDDGQMINFIKGRAQTLTHLVIDVDGPQPSIENLIGMAKELAKEERLNEFSLHTNTPQLVLEVMARVMPELMRTYALNTFVVESRTAVTGTIDIRTELKQALQLLSLSRPQWKPVLSATVKIPKE